MTYPLTSFLSKINVQCGSSSEHVRTEKNNKNRRRKHKLEAGSSANKNRRVYLLPYEEYDRPTFYVQIVMCTSQFYSL